jgi:hypothetical protein
MFTWIFTCVIVENFGMLHMDPEITFYLRTLNMQMTSQSQLIFDKLVYDICPCKEKLFCHNQTKEKLMFILPFSPKIVAQKNII